MKKYISLLLCVAVLATLTACGKDSPKKDAAATTTQSTTTTTTVGGVSGTTATTTTVDGTGADTTTTTATGTDGTTAAPVDGTTTGATTGTATGAPSSSVTGGTTTTTTTAPTTTTTTVARPNVVLPAIGSDIDLVKKKDRIHVVAATAEYDTDGNILVTLTVENSDKSFITEETDYVVYACYDKDGNAVQQSTKLYLGCIDTKTNKKKTYTFTVPASTAEVRIVQSKITYWTEWN